MPLSKTVYLDYAASAPRRDVVAQAELAYDQSCYAGANPNSLHSLGRQAARALDSARSDVARALGGRFRPADVTFTSGGTESNNLCVLGLTEAAHIAQGSRNRVILSAIEHDSVLDLAPVLRGRGYSVDLVRPARDGRVTSETLESLMGPDVALVSVMYANNETGVVQDVPELAKVAHKSGAVFHTDAIQAFGHVPLDLAEVDAVSLAAHKIGGPVGAGAVAVRGRVPIRPMLVGGGQELGRRAGTEDVRGALGFAAAARWCSENLQTSRSKTASMANLLYGLLCAEGTGIVPTTTATADDGKLPGIVSVMVPKLDSETMILELDRQGFEVSAGSACSSGSLDPSHVLSAMGIARNDALGSLRVSFDERIDEQDIRDFAEALLGIVEKHRGDSGHGSQA